MLAIISPSKTQDFSQCDVDLYSQTRHLDNSSELVSILKKKSQTQISKLMSLSEKLSKLNFDRFQKFKLPFNRNNAKQAILAFKVLDIVFKEKKGEVYKVIGIYAKRARGLMVNYIIRNRLKSPEDLKDFADEGYRFNKDLSSESSWVYLRG